MDFLFELPATLLVLALGASVGSFLNVVVYRLPAGLSLCIRRPAALSVPIG